ncbi:hypothetical protein ElyMa_002508300 [Elysia marginata]|uniref:Uncharacterized protein n=1 Tax=Elysia marginata TaxID=1093978 RepID=A0AAV4GQE8_9GAST|nr:hypothetical protein ElyMa_002508300 [Elysia marginata]
MEISDEKTKIVTNSKESSKNFCMEISAENTNIKTNSKESSKKEIKLNVQVHEKVTKFKYLGSIISNQGSKPKMLSRIAQTTAALTKLQPIWNN